MNKQQNNNIETDGVSSLCIRPADEVMLGNKKRVLVQAVDGNI